MMKTYTAKQGDIEPQWILIDAENAVLGRLAAQIAHILRGKHKAQFTPHMDTGDHVIVINADKVVLTGRKKTNKVYYRHTGYPGGIKSATPEEILASPFPERVIQQAVVRMMPKESPLARRQLRKLHVYAGSEHPHEAQKPTSLDFKAQSRKNTAIA